ncbi:MAG TPA: WecB/TagA/CpsF family glycosyltransferase [Pseudolabrys sp.]|jgi:exopolysaccharide biosynthesis WecB/TagA/CpsF family protein
MSETSAGLREFRVDGVSINLLSMPQAISAIVSTAKGGHGFSVFTLNLDHCAKLRADSKFAQAYHRASFVTADGFPIVLLGRLHGVPVQRTAGSDMLEPLCAEAARSRLPIFLLGPNTAVINRAAAHLRERNESLEIAGSYAPGPNFSPESIDADIAIEHIRKSGARICFLAIGAPRQEIFAARCMDLLPDVGFVCVGAALDFIAGTQARAPGFFQRHGLEWVWRLMSNPQRLAMRYLRSALAVPRLLADAIPQAISARTGRTS